MSVKLESVARTGRSYAFNALVPTAIPHILPTLSQLADNRRRTKALTPVASRRVEDKAAEVVEASRGAGFVAIDLCKLSGFDTAGAWLINRSRRELASVGVSITIEKARPEHRTLLEHAYLREKEALPPKAGYLLVDILAELVGLNPEPRTNFRRNCLAAWSKGAALARALALDPELLFLDEPTSGIDPVGAAEFDELIGALRSTLGLTVFMVTHDLDSLYSICDRVAALADGKVTAAGTLEAMLASDHPWLRAYFQGVRGGRLNGATARNKD